MKESIPIFLKIVCILSIVGSFFLTGLNYSAYLNAENAELMKNEILNELDNEFEKLITSENEHEIEEMGILFTNDIENNLVKSKYQSHSLYRMIGNFFTLLGAMLMLGMKRIGLHFYIGGTVFIILTGFYAFGFGPVGWIFNVLYIIVGIVFCTMYLFNRKFLK